MKSRQLTYGCNTCHQTTTFGVVVPDGEEHIIKEPDRNVRVCPVCSARPPSIRTNGDLRLIRAQDDEMDMAESYLQATYGHHVGTTIKSGSPTTPPSYVPTPPPNFPEPTTEEVHAMVDDWLYRVRGYTVPKRGEQ